jgi:hypothetical protein
MDFTGLAVVAAGVGVFSDAAVAGLPISLALLSMATDFIF